jgi:hypothetical protein
MEELFKYYYQSIRGEINIPDDVLEDISIKGKKYGIENVKPFSVDDCVLGEWEVTKKRTVFLTLSFLINS